MLVIRCPVCGKIVSGKGVIIYTLAFDKIHGEPLNEPFCSAACAESKRQERIAQLRLRIQALESLPIRELVLE